MPTGSSLPVRLCLRLLMNVSVMAVTSSICPFSHIAVSILCASRSPVTPLPATLASSRHRAFAALRQIAGNRPVLKEDSAVVKDAAQPSFDRSVV